MHLQKNTFPAGVTIPKLDYLSINKPSPSNNIGYGNDEKFSRSLNAPKPYMEVTLKSDTDFDWGESNTQKKFRIWSPNQDLVRNLPPKLYAKPYDLSTKNEENNNNLDRLEDDKFDHNQSRTSYLASEHKVTNSNEIPALLASVGESMKQINQILYGKSNEEFSNISSIPNTRREANDRNYLDQFNSNPDNSVRFTDLPRKIDPIDDNVQRRLILGSEYYSPGQTSSKREDKRISQNIEKEYVSRFSLIENAEERNLRSYSEKKYDIATVHSDGNFSQPRGEERSSRNLKRIIEDERQSHSARENNSIRHEIGDRINHISAQDEFRGQERAENNTFSKEEYLPIETILPSEKIRQILSQRDLIIIEGELLKYKPGLHYNYSKRWVQATLNEIRYYKTHLAANCWEARPIFSMSFEEIRGLMRVNMKLPKNIKIEGPDKGIKKFAPRLYQFELFPFIDESEQFSNMLHKVDENTNGSKTDRTHENNKTKINIFQVERGHLMCAPALLREGKYPSGLKPKPSNEPSLLNESIIKPKSLASSRDFSLRTIVNDLNQKPKVSKERILNYIPENVIQENPNTENAFKDQPRKNKWVKKIEDLASWTGREKEWYFAEKRLLFATLSDREREVWVAVLNWILNQNS